jgi:predicted dehydrogenase
MLTIPVGHTLDAVEFVLGEVAQVQAQTAIRIPRVAVKGTDDLIDKTVPDQIALHGTLADGGVLSAHFRGGTSRSGDFTWEINGTEGDVVIHSDSGAFLQYGQLQVLSGQGKDRALAPLITPRSYIRVPTLSESGDHASTVAHGYRQLYEDIVNDTHTVPDFAHGARLHTFLETIEDCARSGRRSPARPQ